jgi:hypothetical protein
LVARTSSREGSVLHGRKLGSSIMRNVPIFTLNPQARVGNNNPTFCTGRGRTQINDFPEPVGAMMQRSPARPIILMICGLNLKVLQRLPRFQQFSRDSQHIPFLRCLWIQWLERLIVTKRKDLSTRIGIVDRIGFARCGFRHDLVAIAKLLLLPENGSWILGR